MKMECCKSGLLFLEMDTQKKRDPTRSCICESEGSGIPPFDKERRIVTSFKVQ